ncbi:MAG TPA: SRPBCC domain-containing protein [Candidatus Thermoplasmatota archaeon]|nr:SRPBCC domain-containing protein [Candidatus Thermoplasmatota archaeon]
MAHTQAVPGSTLTLPSDTEILIERSFRAPRALVWRAFTDASLLPKWMGPARYEMTHSEMDVRVGGKFRWVWRLDEGELTMHGTFLEVDAPRRMVTSEHMEPSPTPTHNTFTLTEEKDGRTKVAIRIRVPSQEMRDMMLATNMQRGMDEGYARLDAILPDLAARPGGAHALPGSTMTLLSDTDILLERSFRAPRALVWRAFTEPSLYRKWMGPAEFPMTRCDMDVRPGGKFLHQWGGPDGHQMPGEYVEVDAPSLLAYVDTGETPSRVTITFTQEKDGRIGDARTRSREDGSQFVRTKVAFLARMPSKAARDEILASGWTEGTEACYQQLDALLKEIG